MDDTKDFKTLVAEYIGYNSSSGIINNENKLKRLADKFNRTRILVFYWACGVSIPNEGLKRRVIDYIHRCIG